jgi:hypothetical protein
MLLVGAIAVRGRLVHLGKGGGVEILKSDPAPDGKR